MWFHNLWSSYCKTHINSIEKVLDVSFVRKALHYLDVIDKFKLNVSHLKTYDMNYCELNIASLYSYFSCFNCMVFHTKSVKNHLAYLNVNVSMNVSLFLFLSY